MTEKLLHFIWKFQYFNRTTLQTTSGEPIEIIYPGQHNHQQGPDFLQARIRIGNALFAGSVELHLRTSDWKRHGHSGDANYQNVVLHVVYENDVHEENGLPVLELQPRIPALLLDRYEGLMQSAHFIPCGNAPAEISTITLQSWMDRLLAERLQRKGDYLLQLLKRTGGHWEESFWQLLARSFGAKTNGDAFEAIAGSLPLKILAKHKSSIVQLEALLMGQANLLGPRYEDEYAKLLWREYNFLKTKYTLSPINLPLHFLRMRPPNFPTIRLAQLAALVHQSSHLFSKILETEAVQKLEELFHATANDYWHYYYRFDDPAAFQPKKVGKDMVQHLLINVVAPALFAYGQFHQQEKFCERAVNLLEVLPAEKNAISAGFIKTGLKAEHAASTQAQLELKNMYCNERRCLECAVGNGLLRREGAPQRNNPKV